MNRRNILSTLATSALTLLAPLSAWAGRRPTACRACGQAWNAAVTGEYPCPECGMPVVHDEPLKDWAKRVREEADVHRRWADMVEGNWQAAERECAMLREAHTGKVAEAAELRALLAEAREALMKAEYALAWTSGASDFAPEGAAHGGWTKVVAPATARARDTRNSIDVALKGQTNG